MSSTFSRPVRPAQRAIATGVSLLRAIGFWLAVALALAYPLVFVSAGSTFIDQTMVVGLVAVHVAAVVAGHDHEPSSRR